MFTFIFEIGLKKFFDENSHFLKEWLKKELRSGTCKLAVNPILRRRELIYPSSIFCQ